MPKKTTNRPTLKSRAMKA